MVKNPLPNIEKMSSFANKCLVEYSYIDCYLAAMTFACAGGVVAFVVLLGVALASACGHTSQVPLFVAESVFIISKHFVVIHVMK